MRGPIQVRATAEAATLPGNVHLLLEQIGSAEVLENLSAMPGATTLPAITTPAQLRAFLKNYQTHILEALELPSIREAYLHANSNEVRELIAQDKQFGGDRALKIFAAASCRAGKAQLQRLRPLKDQRVVQRYLAAVEGGEAEGWHTLVYGLTLSVYSFPLRTGLLTYSSQIMRSFIQSAADQLRMTPADEEAMFNEFSASFPKAVETLVASVPVAV
jgi:urease accessory protein UreF